MRSGWVTRSGHLEGVGPWGNVPNWRVFKRVGAGTSREMIEDLYGEPEFSIDGAAAADSVSVAFRDDAGRRGVVTARVAVEK